VYRSADGLTCKKKEAMMIVEQIWTGNSYRNFNYLIVCPETGEALAVDPLDHKKCLALAKDKGWEITQILNTHEHGDHTGGNGPMIQATGAQLIAHENAKDSISGIDRGLAAGDVIKVGKTVELLALDTPGHTMTHICLLSQTETPALFCGDTLFNAGAGNCHGGGHPEELYGTFATQLEKLPDETLVYPGHDYITNNLEFTLDREPDNVEAASLLEDLNASHNPEHAMVTSLGQEKTVNTFFRLTSPTVIKRLREKFPELGESPSPGEVFVRLRELRNDW
jgi:hydroxyacylglutathione hydrolase